MGTPFDYVIPVLSYIYHQRTQALDELYSIVTRVITEAGADARLILPPLKLDVNLASQIIKEVMGRMVVPIAETFVFQVWVHKHFLCGDYVADEELDGARTDWFPKRVKRVLSKAKGFVNTAFIGELEDWLNRYEHVFYETAVLAALVKHVTKQRQLIEITKKFNPMPVRMLPKTFDKLYADLSAWLDAVAYNVSKVKWDDLPQASPPQIEHVHYETLVSMFRTYYQKGNVQVEECINLPIGAAVRKSRALGTRYCYSCMTLSPPPPVYPAKIRMYTCLHYLMYYEDIPNMILALRDKLERKELKYSIWMKTFGFELLYQESAQRALLIQAALTALSEISRGFLEPSYKESFRKLFAKMRRELQKAKTKGAAIMKSKEVAGPLKYPILLLM